MGRKYSNFESDESIVKYFKDVRKSVILTPDEEVELAIKIKNGDEKAIEKLINANLKFVVAIAKEYQGQGLSLADLISEGNYGLIKAANRFDYQRGFRFISYAVWWIKQSIIQSLNDNARMVRLPSNVINKIALLNKEISKFEFLNEREPVFGEIFDKDEEAINIVFYPKCGSLNEVINEDGDELIHLIPSEQIDENKLEITDRIKVELNKVLDILDEREKVIIENYFGINTNIEPMTLEAIGEKYGLTKERIRQIKNKSLRKLRFSSEDLYKVINQVNN